MPKLNPLLEKSLYDFNELSLREASMALLATLGYSSDKTQDFGNSSPAGFLDMLEGFNLTSKFQQTKALFEDWKSADLLFQLTDEELSKQSSLFEDDSVKPGLLRSYLFFAIELTGEQHSTHGNYARGKLTDIARQINRVFPMPVMVLIKHYSDNKPVLSISVINRREHKRESEKDVLGKVTIIRDISLTQPHRGHLDIIDSFTFEKLVHPLRQPINNFDALHAAWEEVFNVELLNKRFYRDLANWYFWAMRDVRFPFEDISIDKDDLLRDTEKVREHDAKNLIRLLTRLLFVWFIKEKDLVPHDLFEPTFLKQKLLKDFDCDSKQTNYYKAVLQNLFFATLNQTHGKREFRNQGQHHNNTSLLRYESSFQDPQNFIDAVEEVTPFLNGGLFECLDAPHPTKRGPKGGKVTMYEDGFSDRKDNTLRMPDYLFFGEAKTENLSSEYGDPKRKKEKVQGLIHILNAYKFTIVENTPIDQEIALDPELLGQVFENLLASYNDETKTTARKQTGSFYTPRSIVDYMVDESLKAYLQKELIKATDMNAGDAEAGLDLLFAYTEQDHPFSGPDADKVPLLINAIDRCSILDPACGSGAFPMGILQKLVYILGKLDPKDKLWELRQLAKVDQLISDAEDLDDATFRDNTIKDLENQKIDIEDAFAKNELGYGRKLYLIENCIYGVDIQSIATQVSKLRFFISLIVEQKVDRSDKNFGIRPLPNLETKFVAANSLIQIEKPEEQKELFEVTRVTELQADLKRVRHKIFSAKTPATKEKHRKKDKELRETIATELELNGWESSSARRLSHWDPYNQNANEDFFDPEWMFGQKGFDIVIGNPPYIQIQKFPKAQKELWVRQNYQTYAATADVYCLFYERGAQLLNTGGHLSYITSNKWMRAGYGKLLQDFLANDVDTKTVLDFGMAQNFGAATTYTCIVQFSKQLSNHETLSCYATDDKAAMYDPQAYFAGNHAIQNNLNSDPWVIISKDRQRVKDLVEPQGIPLGDWDVQINRGILTGFNEAFYITQKQRDTFIAEDPKCSDLLVPLLRGRQISRYTTNWDGGWMINTHNGLREKGVYPINVQKDYPLLWKHLNNWERQLSKRQDKGNHWSNLRNCAYLHDFLKPKIIYPEITKRLGFFFDEKETFFPNNKGFILTSEMESLCYLTAFLNSYLFRCCFRDNFPELMGNTYEVRKIFVDKIPIKKPTPEQTTLFEKLVPLVQLAKKQKLDTETFFLEELIDACVLECYFHKHMKERDLLFQDDIELSLQDIDPNKNDEAILEDFIQKFYDRLNNVTSPIRNKLLRLIPDSPDLIRIIKEEGKV